MNPLANYFRQPSLYISLPSRGFWWREGSIQMPQTGELPVLSMTAADELILKNPDALFSGEATVKLIQSCVPAVADAWSMPVIDLDTLLIAIRIASTGETLDLEIRCPACNETNPFSVDLKQQIQEILIEPWQQPLTVSGLSISLAPLSYRDQSAINVDYFQIQKQMSQTKLIEDPVQKSEITNKLVARANETEIQSVIKSVRCITTPTGSVENADFISEFLSNCDKRIFDSVRSRVAELRDIGDLTKLNIHCPDCAHDFVTRFSLDFANFFDLGS